MPINNLVEYSDNENWSLIEEVNENKLMSTMQEKSCKVWIMLIIYLL